MSAQRDKGEAPTRWVVAAGRTVYIGKAQHGPGVEVTPPADDIERLKAAGFIVPKQQTAPEAPASGKLAVASADGPTIRTSNS